VLKSLFGDLGGTSDKTTDAASAAETGFAATPILETQSTRVTPTGHMVDRHSQELVVVGSPAQAIRKHFATTRADLESASHLITLLDPSNAWAGWVIKALSDAGGLPIERLHLREATTLRTLATIERTTLIRRHEESLKILFADVRAPGRENAEIPVALMERSHLTTVIVGTLQSHAVDALLASVQEAVALPTWRCPNLLFLLPPDSDWIIEKVAAVAWPPKVRVNHRSESLLSASAVWNSILAHWGEVKDWVPSVPADPALLGLNDFPIKVADLHSDATDSSFSLLQPFDPFGSLGSTPGAAASPALPASAEAPADRQIGTEAAHATIDVERLRSALATLRPLEGLLACAVVDLMNSQVLAQECPSGIAIDIDQAAAQAARLLRSHRQASTAMGLSPSINEVTTRSGARQVVIRPVTRQPRLFLWILLDRSQARTETLRKQLSETERLLQ
jgi:hypothetical protein